MSNPSPSNAVAARTSRAWPSVTIGFMPKERFSMSGRALRRLYECTPIDFTLIVVNCDIPPRYLEDIKVAVAGRDVEFIEAGAPLLSNACKALVAEASTADLTCMLENDLMVSEGWLESLITTLEETNADVAVPRVLEGWDLHYHDDGNVGDLVFKQGASGVELHIDPLASSQDLDVMQEPHIVTMTEAHCYLFRTEVLKRIPVFDPVLTAREEIDICLTLHREGVPMVLQPLSRVVFIPPPPVHRDEQPYFLHKWDYDAVVRSHEYIKQKWNLTRIPTGFEIAKTRVQRQTRRSWFLYRAVTRWQRAPFKAWKTVRQIARDRLTERDQRLTT